MNVIHFERLKEVSDPNFSLYMELYRTSFPFHEQRESISQERIMKKIEYRFERLFDGSEFIGLMLNWECENFIYVEHFCILPSKRGLGYGKKALQMLSERGKTVILEIDPPIDDISIRRKAFYEHAGFHTNQYRHVHPPYHVGYKGHELVVMSLPKELSTAEYDGFFQYLSEIVMEKAAV